LASSGAAPSRAPLLVVKGATFLTVSGAPVEGGVLIVDGAKIRELRADSTVPAGATVVDATGKFVTPGFIDAASLLGLSASDLSEGSAELSVLDAIDPFRSTDFASVRATGTTAVGLQPAPRGPFAGMGCVLRLVPGADLTAMSLKPAAFERGALGL